ncbi:carbon-nitrogen hydrolase family protein [Candidatus Pandoraea novymonadis]|nr:carbon-nitrogen hydrolase family protein [Candidatus Pandoraea novymonadis]
MTPKLSIRSRSTHAFAPTEIGAVQMVSTPDVERNLTESKHLIAMAVEAGAKLILLPEYFCSMSHQDSEKLPIAEKFGDGPIQNFLAKISQHYGIWLISGTIPLISVKPNRILNTTIVFKPDGSIAARYNKIHLFEFLTGEESYDEALTIHPGDKLCTFESPFGRVGLSICYDLRFPELYRAMSDCSLMALPAAFTYTTGRAHWEILLRARAIENQCYVLAAAQGGHHENGRHTWGHSMLIDPWGDILAIKEGEGPGIITGKIESERLTSVRESLPALRHRVFSI